MVFSVVDKAKAQFPELEMREWNLAEHPELAWLEARVRLTTGSTWPRSRQAPRT